MSGKLFGRGVQAMLVVAALVGEGQRLGHCGGSCEEGAGGIGRLGWNERQNNVEGWFPKAMVDVSAPMSTKE
jgi:hypothetical protein